MALPCVTPRICSQILSRPQPGGGADCGPCSVIEALFLASCGKFKIGNRERRIMLINQVRNRGGMADLGGTQIEQLAKAFNSYGPEFAALNLKPPKATVLYNVDFEDVFLEHLSRGKMAVAAGEYGPIDLFQSGAISGQRCKRGPHAYCVVDLRTIGANDWVTIVDPLADGRYSGGTDCNPDQPGYVADGPQNMRVTALKDSMTQYTSAGGDAVRGFTFWRAGVLVEPDPDPDPDPDPTTVSLRMVASGNVTEDLLLSVEESDADTIDPNPATPCGGYCDMEDARCR